MLDSNSLYVKDENGNEKRMTILFTFDNEVTKKQYVVFQDPEQDEDERHYRNNDIYNGRNSPRKYQSDLT